MKTLLAIIGFLFLLAIQNIALLLYASLWFDGDLINAVEEFIIPVRSCGAIPCEPECGDLPCEPYYKIIVDEDVS